MCLTVKSVRETNGLEKGLDISRHLLKYTILAEADFIQLYGFFVVIIIVFLWE